MSCGDETYMLFECEYNLLVKALDESNIECADLLQSREYLLGKRLVEFLSSNRRFDVKKICEILKRKTSRGRLKEHRLADETGKNPRYDLTNMQELSKKKYAVYTCITGNYDLIKEPIVKFPNMDFFVYSDNEIKSENWVWRKIPDQLRQLGNTMINRYVKFHPKELFPDYDYAIYVDGNVKIVADIRRLTECTESTSGIAMFNHCLRDCLYEEAKSCILYGKGNKKEIGEQVEKYKKQNFPAHFGLKEATVIFSDLNNNNAANFFENWWKELYYSKSLRDQIALPYSIWSAGFDISSIGCLGTNVYHSNFFRVYPH